MGKMKICINCYFIGDILTKVFDHCLLSGPLPNIHFLSVQTSKFVMATKRLSLKNIKKSTPQNFRSYMGDEAETLQKCSLH